MQEEDGQERCPHRLEGGVDGDNAGRHNGTRPAVRVVVEGRAQQGGVGECQPGRRGGRQGIGRGREGLTHANDEGQDGSDRVVPGGHDGWVVVRERRFLEDEEGGHGEALEKDNDIARDEICAAAAAIPSLALSSFLAGNTRRVDNFHHHCARYRRQETQGLQGGEAFHPEEHGEEHGEDGDGGLEDGKVGGGY